MNWAACCLSAGEGEERNQREGATDDCFGGQFNDILNGFKQPADETKNVGILRRMSQLKLYSIILQFFGFPNDWRTLKI